MSKLHVKNRPYRTLQTASAVKLPFPIHPLMRLVQLSPGALSFGVLKPFCTESTIDIQGFRPNMLSGTSQELLQVAEQVELGTVDLSSVDHAIIAITCCGQAPISDVSRVVLWQTFGVPVYEIFAGLDNSILGYECELHEGWHLAPKVGFSELNGELMLESPGVAGLHTALSGYISNDKCPCGRNGSRLMNMEPIQRLNLHANWAAIA